MIKLRIFSILLLLPKTVLAFTDFFQSQGLLNIFYILIVLVVFFVFYRIIKEAEKEIDGEFVKRMPWNEFKSSKKKVKKIKKSKKTITEAFDKSKVAKDAEGKYYEK